MTSSRWTCKDKCIFDRKYDHFPINVGQDFVKERAQRDGVSSPSSALLSEVSSGLREYFNVLLGSRLLYKFEREQHADVMKERPTAEAAEIYGPIHLLRSAMVVVVCSVFCFSDS